MADIEVVIKIPEETYQKIKEVNMILGKGRSSNRIDSILFDAVSTGILIDTRDMISKKAAIVQLSYNKIGNDDYEMIIQDDINTIKALPPVIPELKMLEVKE